jgi:uncharacterized membrane protein
MSTENLTYKDLTLKNKVKFWTILFLMCLNLMLIKFVMFIASKIISPVAIDLSVFYMFLARRGVANSVFGISLKNLCLYLANVLDRVVEWSKTRHKKIMNAFSD